MRLTRSSDCSGPQRTPTHGLANATVSVEAQHEAERGVDILQLLASEVADELAQPGRVHRGDLFDQHLGRFIADGDRRAEASR